MPKPSGAIESLLHYPSAVDFLVDQIESTPGGRASLSYCLARKTAAEILGKIGNDAAAKDALKEIAAKDKEPGIRKAAEKAWKKIRTK
ncbi:MAG: HEAT repeat domain-containing protein [Planctomycetota bacterium]